MIKEFQK